MMGRRRLSAPKILAITSADSAGSLTEGSPRTLREMWTDGLITPRTTGGPHNFQSPENYTLTEKGVHLLPFTAASRRRAKSARITPGCQVTVRLLDRAPIDGEVLVVFSTVWDGTSVVLTPKSDSHTYRCVNLTAVTWQPIH